MRPERGKVPEKKAVHGRPIPSEIGFTSANMILFAVSFLVIIAGFYFLSRGSITLAPILLVLGYCVLVPLAVIYRPKGAKSREGR